MEKTKIDWRCIERGVPITNDSFFVRVDDETGFVHDDRGGYMHQAYCEIDTRREITWIDHNGSDEMPVERNDMVLLELFNGKLRLRRARLVDWDQVARYRVIRQDDELGS